MPQRFHNLLRHAAAAVFLVCLTVAGSWPLPRELSTDLAGSGIGDNAMFLWNFWWMRKSLALGTGFFHTSYLFAPVGADLTLDTHTALPAFVGATLLRRLPLIAALNVSVLAGLALGGLCAYWLTWRLCRDRSASVVAGVIYGASPYIAAHLNGHFNLTMAWTIPLFALAALEALKGRPIWAVSAGLVLAATAFIDYYYVVYELALLLVLVGSTHFEWSVERERDATRSRWSTALLAAIFVDLLAIVLIVATGGFHLQVGPVRLGMDGLFNPLQILWLLVLASSWVRFRPTWRVRARDDAGPALLAVGIVVTTFAVAASPLLWHGAHLILEGGYVTQRAGWRSAPAGIDIASLALGNPFHGIWGDWVRRMYAALRIDPIESGGWLGIAPVVLAGYTIRRRWHDGRVRTWVAVGGVFFVWALGAHVRAFGWNTGVIMPGALLRFVPIVSNARMPGRAIVIVFLTLAVLSAFAIADLRARSRRPLLVIVVALLAVAVDFCPAPFPTVRVDCPRIYDVLRAQPGSGAVAVLPLGLRDGFGELSPLDHRVLACQPVFDRPIVGGAVARLPPAVLARYRADPLITAWLRMSGAAPLVAPDLPAPDRQAAGDQLAADRVEYVVLNRAAASAALVEYVEHVLPVVPVATIDGYALYRAAR